MIYVMNSAVMPAGNYGWYEYREADIEDLAAVMRGEHGAFKSCIGYPQNAELVELWTGIRPKVNRDKTRFCDGDRAIVMRLKERVDNPATKGRLVSSNPADWEIAWIVFSNSKKEMLIER